MPDAPDLRTQLAAYLAGELDEAASADIEARIDGEPWVARQADAMADLLVALGEVDEIDPPQGFEQRLRDGLAAQIGHELPSTPRLDAGVARASGAAAFDGWRGPAGREEVRRPGREAGRRRRRGAQPRVWFTAAAVLAVLVVGTTTVLQGDLFSGQDDGEDTAEVAADAAATDERQLDATEEAESAAMEALEAGAQEATAADAAPETGIAAEEDAAVEEEAALASPFDGADDAEGESDEDIPLPTDDADAADASDATASQPAPPAGAEDGGGAEAGPAVIQLDGVSDQDQERIRTEVATHPATGQLLGRPNEDGVELAGPYADELLRREPFADGTQPGACLDAVLRDAPEDAVPAVAALLRDGTEVRLAYALVRSTDGETLDQVDVWVTDPATCGVVAIIS